jgi:CHAT domain-containing protein/tetratricopeptide (TPR) repeat protein
MAFQPVSVQGRGFLRVAALALSFLCVAAVHAAAPSPEETLPLGEVRERSIAAGETHGWRVRVEPRTAVAVVIDQQSIDLGLKAWPLAGGKPVAVQAGNDRWGPEVLLLETPGGYRVEIRPERGAGWTGRYALRSEPFPARPAESSRREALALMSRAGQEAVADDTVESRKRAEALYRQALEEWRRVDDRSWAAETLVCLAMLEKSSGELTESTGHFEEALPLWQELKRREREAEALEWLGALYMETQGTSKARDALERSLSLWQSLDPPQPSEVAEARFALCALERSRGSLSKALTCFQENLDYFHEIRDRGQEAEILNSLGGVHDLLGEPDEALKSYEQALALWHDQGDRVKEAKVLNNIAVVHRTLGEWQEALRVYGRIRDVQGSRRDDTLEGARLSNIGYLYSIVGEPERALRYLSDALTIRHKLRDAAAEIKTLNSLGIVWLQLGNPVKALECHRKALDLASAPGREDSAQQASSRLLLAEIHLDRGDAIAALRELDAALTQLGEAGSPRALIEILHHKGRALLLSGRAGEARDILKTALDKRRLARDRAGEAETLYELARVERSLGNAAEARLQAAAAVKRVEELRIGVLATDLRTSFLATQHRAYSLLIDLLMDWNVADPGKGHDQEAFAVSESARARSLVDALRSGSPGRSGAASPELLAQRNGLLRHLSAKIEQLRNQSGERAAALQREINDGLIKMSGVEQDILSQDPRFASFSSSPPVDLREIYGWLEPGTVLLEYSLGEDRSFLWVLAAGQMHSFVLPSQREIGDLAREVHRDMSSAVSGSARRGKAAARLSQILLGPVWSLSETTSFHRLIVVPDGALGVVPFAALPVPPPEKSGETREVFLLESSEVVIIPSATTLSAQRQQPRRPPPSKWAAVLADPIFDAGHLGLARGAAARASVPRKNTASKAQLRGLRTEGAAEALEPLPATRNEAKAIQSLAPSGLVWLGLGLDANRETVISGELRDYRVLHFATHAVADTRNPELSGLFLSRVDAGGHPRNGFLGLSDIYDLDLDAGLVVLSGCRTALGKEVRGEGLMGLTRGFLYAGVPRVVASLWPVQDRATAKLMTLFYQAMWRDRDPLAPAAALREAQQSLSRDSHYRNPYFWAGFVLQGDWR